MKTWICALPAARRKAPCVRRSGRPWTARRGARHHGARPDSLSEIAQYICGFGKRRPLARAGRARKYTDSRCCHPRQRIERQDGNRSAKSPGMRNRCSAAESQLPLSHGWPGAQAERRNGRTYPTTFSRPCSNTLANRARSSSSSRRDCSGSSIHRQAAARRHR
jgi:hypothetical protein